MEAAKDEPTRSALIGWLKLNLGITVALFSVVSGAAGSLVGVSWSASKYDSRLVAVEAAQAKAGERTHDIEINLAAGVEHRITLAQDFGAVKERLGVLESQVKFIGDLVHEAPSRPAPPGAARK